MPIDRAPQGPTRLVGLTEPRRQVLPRRLLVRNVEKLANSAWLTMLQTPPKRPEEAAQFAHDMLSNFNIAAVDLFASSSSPCAFALRKGTLFSSSLGNAKHMHRTATEAKDEHVSIMGLELGEFYTALWQELAWIHAKWSEYVALFGTNRDRIDLLNNAAPKFFRIVEDSLWEDVLLHLSRLTDAPKSMGKDNLSVLRLTSLKLSSGKVPQIQNLVDNAVASTEFARDWRNRKLAHKDLALALGQSAQPLAPASRQQVRDALSALGAILNALSLAYLGSTTRFESDDASAISLLYVLRDGLRHESERKERINAQNFRPEDLKPDPL